jgi:hypothetical protein
VTAANRDQIAYELRARLTDWQGILGRHVGEARGILRKLLVGRLVFTPSEAAGDRYYKFSGQGTLSEVCISSPWPVFRHGR